MAKITWRINPYTGRPVWTYGDYGGPGWTGGEFTPPGQEPKFTLPGQDPLDKVFKRHDQDYKDLRDVWDKSDKSLTDINRYWDSKRAADNKLLGDIRRLRESGELGPIDDPRLRDPNLSPEENNSGSRPEAYRAADQAELLFEAIKRREDSMNKRITNPDNGSFDGGNLNDVPWTDTGIDGAGGSGGGNGADGGPGDAGGRAGADGAIPRYRDPLVLDLDGDGIETTSTRNGVAILFDHDADGVKTGTGWVKPDDGWLVLDRNGNGTIDSGRELFGNHTQSTQCHKAGQEAANRLWSQAG